MKKLENFAKYGETPLPLSFIVICKTQSVPGYSQFPKQNNEKFLYIISYTQRFPEGMNVMFPMHNTDPHGSLTTIKNKSLFVC